jgi:glycine hydroxymethyltransferase
MIMLDVMATYGISGKEAEERLDAIGITVNKNMIPDDSRGPMDPSGIRVGVPALTTRGLKQAQVKQIVACMDEVLRSPDPTVAARLRKEVRALCRKFPVPKEFR